MDKEFEIEVQDQNVEKSDGVQLPVNFLSFGEIESDDVKVYIKQDVYKALEKLASSDTSKELGSIIFGDYCEEYGKTHVVISSYVEAKYTDASASTLTFTHETWDYVHSEHEKRYPEKKIVGWQHTHPNYGIFLSNYDMFIQENFFNLPFQIAYVIDPIQNIRGFFQWKNGRIEKLKGFYVYDDVGKPIKIEQTKVKKEEKVASKTSKLMVGLVALLCAVVACLSVFVVSLNSKYEKQLKKQDELLAEVVDQKDDDSEQQNEIDSQITGMSETLKQLQGYFENGVLDTKNSTTVSELIEKLQEQDNIINALKEAVENKSEGEVRFVAYTVVEGDTLPSICDAHGVDYYSNIKIILTLNGIEDPNRIFVGQTILLPVAE